MPGFLPSRDSELVTWSLNFSTRITATPTAFGLTAPQATAYGALHDAFVAAYNVSSAEATNSTSAVLTKNTARTSLTANARMLAGIVQKYPAITDAQRADLGLNVKASPAPVPPPALAPDIDIVSVAGNTVRIKLHNSATLHRAKPTGVKGAAVFSFVGPVAPSTEAAWTFQGNTTQTVIDVEFPAETPPGSKVWFTAFWFNPRAQSGPAASPVSTNVAGGSAMAA